MTASTQIKKGIYYTVVSWQDTKGKRHQKWISTKLKVDGNNKRKAEAERLKVLYEYQEKITLERNDMLFSEWMLQWLDETKGNIAESTYFTYKTTIENVICPYFQEINVKLCDLKPYHIQDFYTMKMNKDGVSANTIYHYHANIHKALKYAVKMERLKTNPADNVELPKKQQHIANYYTADELKMLLSHAKGTVLEPVVNLAAWFGLRRGEIIGLRWSSIDFDNKRLSVTGVIKDKGTSQKNRDLYFVPTAKTKSSIRSFPMTDFQITYLKELKVRQDERSQTVKGYNPKWDDFVCVRENGDLISPEYVTRAFPQLCKKSGLRPIKLHELRHTNISLLLENGASMKELQEWAGHSSYSTTANIYSHIQAKSKERLSETIENLLA